MVSFPFFGPVEARGWISQHFPPSTRSLLSSVYSSVYQGRPSARAPALSRLTPQACPGHALTPSGSRLRTVVSTSAPEQPRGRGPRGPEAGRAPAAGGRGGVWPSLRGHNPQATPAQTPPRQSFPTAPLAPPWGPRWGRNNCPACCLRHTKVCFHEPYKTGSVPAWRQREQTQGPAGEDAALAHGPPAGSRDQSPPSKEGCPSPAPGPGFLGGGLSSKQHGWWLTPASEVGTELGSNPSEASYEPSPAAVTKCQSWGLTTAFLLWLVWPHAHARNQSLRMVAGGWSAWPARPSLADGVGEGWWPATTVSSLQLLIHKTGPQSATWPLQWWSGHPPCHGVGGAQDPWHDSGLHFS